MNLSVCLFNCVFKRLQYAIALAFELPALDPILAALLVKLLDRYF